MPAKDRYHDTAKTALVRDGWTITHDPLTLRVGKKDLFVDLGAEKLLAAEKGGQKIAIEVKSFVGRSEIRDLEQALGQYVLYRKILEIKDPDRKLYLAIRELVYNELFEEPIGQLLIDSGMVEIVVFSEESKEILRWIP